MKKILCMITVCLLVLCCLTSCASPRQQAANQDLVNRMASIKDAGKEITVKDKRVCLYSLIDDREITVGYGWFRSREFTNCIKLVQYANYFEMYTENAVYILSNTAAGYTIYYD